MDAEELANDGIQRPILAQACKGLIRGGWVACGWVPRTHLSPWRFGVFLTSRSGKDVRSGPSILCINAVMGPRMVLKQDPPWLGHAKTVWVGWQTKQ